MANPYELLAGLALLREKKFINDLVGGNWTTQQVWERYVTPRIPNAVASDTQEVFTWLRKINKYPQDQNFSEKNLVERHRFATS